MSRPQPFAGAATLPGLEFGYAPADTRARQLADPHVLAVFGFGAHAPVLDDPRWLRVPLQPLGAQAAPIEVWRSAAPVRSGRDGDVAWSTDGNLLFGALEIDELDDGLEAAARRAYARLGAFLAGGDMPHLLRIWNYMDAITLGEEDAERYRRFCVGRVAGMEAFDAARLPAATAIGRHDGVRRLQVYWLAAREPGRPVENPRQVSAYRYPRQYGPQAPSFARAMLPPAGASMPLLLSGTAAIVGHASQHSGSVQAQVDETLANLASLVDTARRQSPELPAVLGAGSPLKVYVRDPSDAEAVAARLDASLDPSVPRLLLHAQVCRRELLVEIDGVHGAASA
ncbi:pteridine-dependent deoxygenase [Pseudoxanthomonas daejeonensis]|uniref:chorismate transformation enzyme, FkbO/Hyg5 family n=1 Tax=Pseudoxanthomonas daejeonensis TaxID=266062 RepID=UPI001F543FEC|nr:pteridine-dependent deoxygenase [Pseudoxanthomonas daejeonensis]UNK58966.1 pteridine-dependent deoxygenase [Pseudoxanthomonas daejeonensis]